MSRAVDLHRGRQPITSLVERWLERRGWKSVVLATGARLASPPGDAHGMYDLMEAVLLEIQHDEEANDDG